MYIKISADEVIAINRRQKTKDTNSSKKREEHGPGGQVIEARSKVQHKTETDMTICSKEL